MSARRVISFEEDIIRDVVKKTGGKYTEEQVSEVLRASILYARMLLKYTPNCKVVSRKMGYFYVNVRDARNRLRVLEEIEAKGLPKNRRFDIELAALREKVRDIEADETKERAINRTNPMYVAMYRRRQNRQNGRSWDEVQDEQEDYFNTI